MPTLDQIIQITTIVQNLVFIVTGVIGSIVAVKGYSAWFSQLRGTDNYTVGKKVIHSITEFRDGLSTVRNPFMFESEFRYSEDELKNLTTDIKRQEGLKGLTQQG
jgi:hypothetical protein